MSGETNPSSSDATGIPGLESDPEGAQIVADEIRILSGVKRALSAIQAPAPKSEVDDDARLLALREDIAAAKPEDLPALFEQMHTIGVLRAHRGKSITGAVDPSSPYFGHLCLEEQVPNSPKPRRRDVLLGAQSFIDSNHGVSVVDWRNAPVSRLFYRYREGDDYEETFGERLLEGIVIARRSVAIVRGELVRVSAPQGTYVRDPNGSWRQLQKVQSKLVARKHDGAKGGGIASDVKLGVGADGRIREDKVLPAIASMLDKEQFDLITKPGTGVVAIQGSAGSGKTTVGLHRVAYLHSIEPERFRPDRMLVVVPTEALIHYVGRVLPDLGVDGVRITTAARFARRAVIGLFPKLPTAVSDETPISAAAVKSHSRIVRAIDTIAERLEKSTHARLEQGLAKWDRGHEILIAFDKQPKSMAVDLRLAALGAWLAGKRELFEMQSAAIPEQTRATAQKLVQELRTKARNIVQHWDEMLTDKQLLATAFEGSVDIGKGQLEQAYEWNVRQIRVRGEGDRDGERPTIDAEDAPLLLRLWQRLRGPITDESERPIRLNHLFVDEVQDHSPIELTMLLDLLGGENRSATLAGDFAQRMLEDGDTRAEFQWSQFLEDLGLPAQTLEPLKVSYRSTEPITRFARAVLGPYAHEAEPVTTRSGPPVELFTFAGQGEAVAFLADALKQLAIDEPSANVAIVARFPQHADVYFEGLERAEVNNVRRIARQNFTWERGVDVTDVRQTKGLEFDEVVLVETTEASYPDAANARHALYVAATRASHQLWCIASDTTSPLVETALEQE